MYGGALNALTLLLWSVVLGWRQESEFTLMGEDSEAELGDSSCKKKEFKTVPEE